MDAGELFATLPQASGGGGIACLWCDDRPADIVATHLLEALRAVVAAVLGARNGCGVERRERSLCVTVQKDADGVPDQVANSLLKRRVIGRLEKIRVSDARVSGHRHEAQVCSPQPPVELEREDQIGELGLLIRLHWRIKFGGLQIVKVQPPSLMRNGGDSRNARFLAGFSS